MGEKHQSPNLIIYVPCHSLFKATFSFHKITTKTLKCLSYILISHFTWLLQWFIILDMNNLVNVSHHYWMLLKLSIKMKSTWAAKWLPFQTREVQQGIARNLGTNPNMNPCVKMVRKYSRRAHRDPHKFISFLKKKQISGRNGEHDDLEWPMLSYYVIYCEKFRKVLQQTEKVALKLLVMSPKNKTFFSKESYSIEHCEHVIEKHTWD